MILQATQTFRLQGITVLQGQPLPDRWPPNLRQRIAQRGLATHVPDPAEENVVPEPDMAIAPLADTAQQPGVVVVTLSCYPDIFAVLRCQLAHWEPNVRKILVTSGKHKFEAPGWEIVPGVEPFIFGRNANAGIRAAGLNDVLLLNDDVRLKGPIVGTLTAIAQRHADVGILAPQVNGGCGNLTQCINTRIAGDVAYPSQDLAFIAVYIKHAALTRAGLFDERFTGYGCEDSDMCMRVKCAGLRCAVTPRAVVAHGHGGRPCSSSFLRQMTPGQQMSSMAAMRKTLNAKWAGLK